MMTSKAMAMNIINNMSEEQLIGFINLFKWLLTDMPNDETLAAMQEAEDMLNDTHAQKFSSVEDLFEELRA